MKHQDAQALLARQIERARRAIAIERAVAALFPAALLLALWLAANLGGLMQLAPPLAQSLGGFAALLASAALLARGFVRLAPVDDRTARARLAADGRLEPGALEALEDSPARLDPLGLALWRRAQERALAVAEQVRAGPARPAFHRIDPLGLRFVAGLALVAGLAIAGREAPQRLWQALAPDPGPLMGDKPIAIEAWAAPAPYTGAAPISLSNRTGERIATPPSLEVVVRVTGPAGPPRLRFEAKGADQELRLAPTPDGAYEGRLQISEAGVLKLIRFREKARWRLAPSADAAPRIAWDKPPEADDETLYLGWRSEDDYGVQKLLLRLRLVEPPPGQENAPPLDVTLEGPAPDEKASEGESELNLVDHAFAGLPVIAELVAVDGAGQEGVSDPAAFKLPERIFLQPLARAAIEIRRDILLEQRPYAPRPKEPPEPASFLLPGPGLAPQRLIIATDDVDPRFERAPAGVKAAARKLDALTMAAEDGYFLDLAVFIGFRGARGLIEAAGELDELEEPAQVLWDTAMRAEYGASADARRALDEAQKALAEALRRGAGADEIARLSQKLREATRNYLEALRQEALRENRTAETRENDGQQATQLTRNDIDALLNEVQRLSEAGEHEAAAALLERIASLLENLQVQLASGPGQGGEQGEPGEQQLREQIDGLSDAIGQQRGLNDETERLQRGQPGQEGEGEGEGENGQGQAEGDQPGAGPGADGQGDSPGNLAERQRALRRALRGQRGQLPGGQDEARGELDEAGEAMERAEESLRNGDLAGARQAQDEALDRLRRGAGALARNLQRQGDGEGEGERDPLGRRVGGGVGEGDEVAVPDAQERQRARDILDELRRRAADPDRSETERSYLRRLLEQFSDGS